MSPLLSRAAFLVLVLGLGLGSPAASGEAPAPDLVYREVTVGGGRGHLLEIDLTTAGLRVLDSRAWGKKAMTAAEFAVASGAAAVINAPFFDIDGSPMGLLVVDGDRKQKLRRADWGVFYIDASGAHIVHTSEYAGTSGVQQAFQVGPRLVVGGEALALKPQSARRTAVCVRPSGKVLAVVTHGAVQATDLAGFLREEGCVDALNLDGGPSSQMWVSSGDVAMHEPGGTAVPIAVGVFPGRPASHKNPGGGCGG